MKAEEITKSGGEISTDVKCTTCIYYDKLLDICFYTTEWRTVWDEREACEHWENTPN